MRRPSGALARSQIRTLRATPAPAGGNRLGSAIRLAGVSQNDVARATGLTQPYVSDVVRGRYRTITLQNAWKFARYFGIALEDLFAAPD